MPRWSALTLLLLLLGAGCASTPSPVIRLAPRGEDAVWVAGRAAVTRIKNGVRVAAAFERQDERLLALRVEIDNGSSGTLDVDPNGMTFTTCSGDDKKSCRSGDTVVDPEEMLFKLDARRSRQQAEARDDRAARGPLILLGGVGDIANATGGHLTSNAETEELAGKQDAERHQDAVSRIEREKELWSNVALRHTTLRPGQAMSGMVYLPINKKARFVWLQIAFGDLVFPFCFQQTLIPIAS